MAKYVVGLYNTLTFIGLKNPSNIDKVVVTTSLAPLVSLCSLRDGQIEDDVPGESHHPNQIKTDLSNQRENQNRIVLNFNCKVIDIRKR